jgi:hypothetical protein
MRIAKSLKLAPNAGFVSSMVSDAQFIVCATYSSPSWVLKISKAELEQVSSLQLVDQVGWGSKCNNGPRSMQLYNSFIADCCLS